MGNGELCRPGRYETTIYGEKIEWWTSKPSYTYLLQGLSIKTIYFLSTTMLVTNMRLKRC